MALVMDEFQEAVAIDADLPRLLRAVFQQQPEIAHVYLGSRRHVMERIFNDENEPFWRSAKPVELGRIAPAAFAGFIEDRFAATGKAIEPDTAAELTQLTGGHPYATQELCYYLWEESPPQRSAGPDELRAALAAVLRSEHAHFTLLWDRASGIQKLLLAALAAEQPGRPFTVDYRRRHNLPSASSLQRAARALVDREIVATRDGAYEIAEPFLAEWIRANMS